MIARMAWTDWLDALPAKGRLVFELKEAVANAKGKESVARVALARAVKDKRIVRIGNGLYAYVAPEFRPLGAPPFEWVLRFIFEKLSRPYYLCLLSAAAFHGASHQQPMTIYVMTPRQMKSFQYGPHRVRYLCRKVWPSDKFLEEKSAPTGKFRISNPWLTLLDLVRYPEYSGGLDNVATIIREMDFSESLPDLNAMESLAVETAVLQRLGWLLQAFGQPSQADWVERILRKRKRFPVLLEPGTNRKGKTDDRFRVIVNHQPEAEA